MITLPTTEEQNQIQEFMTYRQSFLEGWFNGTVAPEALDEYAKYMAKDWILVNNQTPAIFNNKPLFLQIWPSMYGRLKDKPINQSFDIKKQQKLSENLFLLTFLETTDYPDKSISRPVSIMLQLADPIQVVYVHESSNL